MNEINQNTIVEAVSNIANSVGQTANAISTIKKIKRTTGISRRQSKRLKLEAETNTAIANDFKKWCNDNPGFLYMSEVGNIKLSNIGKVLDYAQKEFEENEEIPKEQLDKEWLTKFLDVAGETCDEEKQKILAKVFCGQLKKPDCISYRTLRILKDLSTKDIYTFKKTLKYSFYNSSVLMLPNGVKNLHINYSEIMHMCSCELILSSDEKSLSLNGDGSYLLNSGNEYILRPKNNTKTDISCYAFTESAQELFRLITIEKNSLENIINSLAMHKDKIVLNSIKSIDKNIITFDEKNLFD